MVAIFKFVPFHVSTSLILILLAFHCRAVLFRSVGAAAATGEEEEAGDRKPLGMVDSFKI